jgi:ketosteroid isomerase-like protein
MRTSLLSIALLTILSGPVLAQNYGPQPNSATRTEILALRDSAWRTWFSNDVQGFSKVVPEELVALGWSGGAWADRALTLKQMQDFAGTGRKIKALEFPENVFQQYGDVVILYTRFRITLSATDSDDQIITGRGTEVFVRRHKRWIHTGWHLDTVSEND